MRIGLDLRMLGGGSGIDRYITELSHALLKQDKTNQYVLFFRNEQLAQNYKQYDQKIVIADIPHYSVAEQLEFPGILKKEQLDLVHFPHFNVPIFYRKPFVVTIHDLTHTLFPGKKKSRFFHRLAFRWVFWSTLKNSRKIIAVSEATKKEIINHFRIPADKISVVYEGYNENYRMINKDDAFAQISNSFGITKPYILYVGVWRRYKNLPMLVKAFERLIEKGLDMELVLAGEPDPFYPEIKEQVYRTKYKERLKPLGRVSDDDLNLLYNAAQLFVFPSLMEGFGLALLEAAVTGTPVACSDLPVFREVSGQAAEYFDPNNLENMVDVLFNLLQKPARAEELANLGLKRASLFSWNKAASETIKVYNSI